MLPKKRSYNNNSANEWTWINPAAFLSASVLIQGQDAFYFANVEQKME